MRLVIIAALLIILSGCTDDLTKTSEQALFPRIEYSNCTACYECLDEFQCPRDAIIIDELHQTVYIDQEKCIRCLDCVNDFECQYDAIKLNKDVTAPAAPQQFSAFSDSIGTLNISFFAPGDDSLTGFAYLYELELREMSGNILETNFIPPIPSYPDSPENWQIGNMPENETINVTVRVYDEMGHCSQPAATAVEIMGEYIDLEAPAAINDLNSFSDEYEITLTWTAPADPEPRANVASYEIRSANINITAVNWDAADEIEQDITPAAAGETETLTISYVEASGLQYFAIRSLDAAGNISEISNNASGNATGDITAPAQITDLSTGLPGNTSIPLNWTAVGDNGNSGQATAYIIRYHQYEINEENWDEATVFPQNMIPHLPGITEQINITGLLPESEYYFAVIALDEVNNPSPISNRTNATTTALPDTEAPAPVTDLQSAVNDPEIILNWTAPGDDGNEGTASTYEMRYSETEITEANWDTATILENLPNPAPAGAQETFIIDFLAPGINWYFALIASDEENNVSALSNNAQALIPLDETAPAPVNDLSAETTETDIILTWTAPGDDGDQGTAASYDLRWSLAEITEQNWQNAAQLLTPAPQPAGTEETMTLSDFDSGITYYFALKSADEEDNISLLSNNCDAYIEIIIDETPPAAITDLAVNAGQASYGNRITITWTAPGDDGNTGTCTAYEVRYRQSPITAANWGTSTVFNSPPIPDPAGSSESVTVTGLTEGIIYYFAVIGIDEAGNQGSVSNSPGGKCCYQILAASCSDCNNCINTCDEDAIYDAGYYKAINPNLCVGCGDCVSHCPHNAIRRWVIAY
ncbi:MAG: 4Fe-4S binding protein [Candidatus Cloacimonetes bacterium]|nr:4Fe-4S binding protein [Candidatus Cloacimonadota bacterium]